MEKEVGTTETIVKNDKINSEENCGTQQKSPSEFKKPVLVGKVGRIPRKIIQEQKTNIEGVPEEVPLEDNDKAEINTEPEEKAKDKHAQLQLPKVNNTTVPYQEPEWSALPESSGQHYSFDVLKNGTIIETINLMKRPYWIFGRLENCHISMQHPTISRYHAVLQYRNKITDDQQPGFYIYDLESTHGTFLNKRQVKSRTYVKMQVGHMLKLGCSTRTYFLNGPEEDAEEESELTITQLKQKREAERLQREEEQKKRKQEEEQRMKKEEERGVDWGIGDDADEETDLAENPYAQTNNEELYIDDPKKALRGFFEREGLDLEYDCSEQGMGQYLCKIMLPLDDERGRPIYAEVLHKGKKKEAVIQCALEACKILDRHGVLRQATHESRKRKAKNWEENDYYDSDEDTFLDRTGTIEKKRENRMKSRKAPEAETYHSLLEKERKISESIAEIENQLKNASASQKSRGKSENQEEDSLDSYMKELKQPTLDKQKISRLKTELAKLKQDHSAVVKLLNIAKPADLPTLTQQYSSQPSTSTAEKSKKLPIFGKRLKLKVQFSEKPKTEENQKGIINDDIAEEDDEELEAPVKNPEEATEEPEDSAEKIEVQEIQKTNLSPKPESFEENSCDGFESPTSYEDEKQMVFLDRIEESINKIELSPLFSEQRDKVNKVLNKIKKLASEEDRMSIDWKLLAAKRRKVQKLIENLQLAEFNSKIVRQVRVELNRILVELDDMTNKKYKAINSVKEVVDEIRLISAEIKEEEKRREATGSHEGEEDDEKKKKKNQKRIQQRQSRNENERQKGYEEDAAKEDYNMWVPPTDQTGDGRTSLNDKLGY